MTVAELWIYPVKSFRGQRLDAATVEPRGLRHDRRFMVVNEEGLFQTQRRTRAMATVAARIKDGALILEKGDTRLALSPEADGPRVPVTVWEFPTEAHHVREADAFLAEVLGPGLRLVRMPDDVRRRPSELLSLPRDVVSFADGYPVLLASRASLADLVTRAGEDVPMDRFRANVIVEGAPEPWAEQEARLVHVGAVPFRNAKPCVRCAVTTIDQTTGEARGPEPLRTLATYPKWGPGVTFGINLLPDDSGEIAVGDPVEFVR